MRTAAQAAELLHVHTPFSRFARWTARGAGNSKSFVAATLLILGWLVTGPMFRFSDTWQLVINTATTIVTFLMVFLIQNTQNRDAVAVQLKLDELIRAVEGAHNCFLDLEELTQEDLEAIKHRYEDLARQARDELRVGRADTGRPDVALP